MDQKQIALYTFQALITACENTTHNNCDIRDWEMNYTHNDYKFYCQYEHAIREMSYHLIRCGFADKLKIKGKHGYFEKYRPSKLGLERFKQYWHK